MPTLLEHLPELPPPPMPPRKRWTREECARLEAGGFELERLELVDGELIRKMGKHRPHVNAFTWLQLWLMNTFGWQFVNAEAPIDVSPADNPSNEPVPDLIVLNRDFQGFHSNPQPADLKLVVEIADSSLSFDLGVKALLYARAGIVEYWVVNVARRQLIVHRNPVSGRYASVVVYDENEAVAPLAAPHAEFRPAQAFAG